MHKVTVSLHCSLGRQCSEHETALILAIGEHGVVYSDLASQLEGLAKLQASCAQACQHAVGYFGVKSASDTLDKAQVRLQSIVGT